MFTAHSSLWDQSPRTCHSEATPTVTNHSPPYAWVKLILFLVSFCDKIEARINHFIEDEHVCKRYFSRGRQTSIIRMKVGISRLIR
jgi:hypothetical protein